MTTSITEINKIVKRQKNLSPSERILFGKKFFNIEIYYRQK